MQRAMQMRVHFNFCFLQLLTVVVKCIRAIGICVTLDGVNKQQFTQFDKFFGQYFNKHSLNNVFDYDQLCAIVKKINFVLILY